ncbi:MAG: hypothetical protein M3N18_02730 [Actinomycetota bacterium]|nr:hypothetical protein [Actinomycetota bacterium]
MEPRHRDPGADARDRPDVQLPELVRVLKKALAEAEGEPNRALGVLDPLLEGDPERIPLPRRDLAALSCVNGALSEAVERLGAVDSEAPAMWRTTGGQNARYPKRAASSYREHGRRWREPDPAG